MSDANEAARTLFYPFETGLLEPSELGASVIVYGARAGFRLPAEISAKPVLVQGFKPDHMALQAAGMTTVALPEGEAYDAALILGSKHRGQNEHWIADAQTRVKPGGLILAAASKKDGGDSLRRRMAETIGIEDHAVKYHGNVFWLRAGAKMLELAPSQKVGIFTTKPGMFSHDHADPGSQFLVDHLPADLSGDIADLCAGWGFLSEAASHLDGVGKIALYEADYASLEAAREALGDGEGRFTYHWQDLASEPVNERYDAIIMNPPFHNLSRKAEPDMGVGLIKTAAAALKNGGKLYLVANRPLPYEDAMAELFIDQGEIARNEKFKVLWGEKGSIRKTRKMQRALMGDR